MLVPQDRQRPDRAAQVRAPGSEEGPGGDLDAEDEDHVRAAAKAFEAAYGAKLTFASGRQRTKVTTGPGSRAAGLAMAFKLIEAAQDRWRAVHAPHLVALVRAGARFERGALARRHDQQGRAA